MPCFYSATHILSLFTPDILSNFLFTVLFFIFALFWSLSVGFENVVFLYDFLKTIHTYIWYIYVFSFPSCNQLPFFSLPLFRDSEGERKVEVWKTTKFALFSNAKYVSRNFDFATFLLTTQVKYSSTGNMKTFQNRNILKYQIWYSLN